MQNNTNRILYSTRTVDTYPRLLEIGKMKKSLYWYQFLNCLWPVNKAACLYDELKNCEKSVTRSLIIGKFERGSHSIVDVSSSEIFV